MGCEGGSARERDEDGRIKYDGLRGRREKRMAEERIPIGSLSRNGY